MTRTSRYTPEEIAAIRKWAEHWKRVGPLLEKFRHEELRAMTDADVVRAFDALSGFVAELPPEVSRPSSGFVQQQQRFAKLRGS
jgi:hypothetical protein